MSPPCRSPRWVLLLSVALLPAGPADAQPPAAAGTRPRTDGHGNPLPAGALFRLGGAPRRGAPVAFSPDGRLLAAVDWDTVRLLETATGKQRRHCTGHEGLVHAVAFSNNGRLLASGADDRTVRLWDPATGRAVRELRGHVGKVHAVAFSPDGRFVASGDSGGTVRLWDAGSGKLLRQFPRSGKGISCVTFSPDGATLAAGGWDRTVRLWDVASGAERRRLVGHLSGVCAVAFAPDGQRLVCATWDSAAPVHQWDVATGKALPSPRGDLPFVRAVGYSPDSRLLVGGGDASAVLLWDAATGRELRRLETPGGRYGVQSVVFSSDGKLLAAATAVSLRLWDTAAWKELPQFAEQPCEFRALAFSPDGRLLATGDRDGLVRFWEAGTGRPLSGLSRHGILAESIAFSPDGKSVAAAGRSGLRLWPIAAAELPPPLRGSQRAAPTAVVFAPGGKTLASAGGGARVRHWDADTSKEIPWHGSDEAESLVFSGDGTLLATGQRGRVRVWDLATDGAARQMEGFGGQVCAVAFSLDGRTLATADRGGHLGLSEVLTGKPRRALVKYEGVLAVAFSRDGHLVACGAVDGTVRLCDVVTGKERARLGRHGGPVVCVAISADGTRVASASDNTTLLVWDVSALRNDDRRPRLADLSAETLTASWAALAGTDAEKAFAAVKVLAAAPGRSVPFLGARLAPVARVGPDALARLVGDLDSPTFARRQRATEQLERLEYAAEPALREALKAAPTLEMKRRLEHLLGSLDPRRPSGAVCRRVRSVEVLERAGTPAARELLRVLATGAPAAILTREARAAVRRLAAQDQRGARR